MLSNISALSGGIECRIQVMRNQQWWLSTIAAILPEGSGLAAELSEESAMVMEYCCHVTRGEWLVNE